MQIPGKTFLVTGAGSGLGAATARLLAEAGARTVLADINDASALATELGGAFIRTDVTDEAQAQAAVALATDRFGALHGLVNCAGIVLGERVSGRGGPHRLDTFARVIGVNVVGTFNMIRLAAAAIRQSEPDPHHDPHHDNERGVIVSTASVAAFDGQVGQAAYAASKGAVASMTLPIARELARDGIRVVAIAPGIFETPMMSGMPADVQASLGASVPFPPRLGRPAEYAALVRHVVENTMLNGEVIRLDGALRMAPK